MLVYTGGGVLMLGMACSMLRFLWFVFWGGWGFVMSSLCWSGFAYCVSVEVVRVCYGGHAVVAIVMTM